MWCHSKCHYSLRNIADNENAHRIELARSSLRWALLLIKQVFIYQGSATFWRHYVHVCMCMCMCSKERERERWRELHSVVLEFQPTLTKVGGLDVARWPGAADPWYIPQYRGLKSHQRKGLCDLVEVWQLILTRHFALILCQIICSVWGAVSGKC